MAPMAWNCELACLSSQYNCQSCSQVVQTTIVSKYAHTTRVCCRREKFGGSSCLKDHDQKKTSGLSKVNIGNDHQSSSPCEVRNIWYRLSTLLPQVQTFLIHSSNYH